MAIDGWLLYRIQSKRNTTENNTLELAFQASAIGNKGRIMRHTHTKMSSLTYLKKRQCLVEADETKKWIHKREETNPTEERGEYIYTHTYLLDEETRKRDKSFIHLRLSSSFRHFSIDFLFFFWGGPCRPFFPPFPPTHRDTRKKIWKIDGMWWEK
jgi:hypothetical protein